MNDEKPIDLGVSRKEMYGDMPAMAQAPQGSPDKVYPSFSYSGPVELHLPESGCMEIKFHKVSETSSVRPDGSHWYECRIEVKCVCEVESDEPKSPTSRDRSAEEALDTLARKLSESREEEEGEGEEEE